MEVNTYRHNNQWLSHPDHANKLQTIIPYPSILILGYTVPSILLITTEFLKSPSTKFTKMITNIENLEIVIRKQIHTRRGHMTSKPVPPYMTHHSIINLRGTSYV